MSWWPFPIASMLGSSSAIVLGQDVYGKGPRPIIRWFHKRFYWFSTAIWNVRYRTQRRHAYHLVDTRLKPGYHDLDERMLYACFSLLIDYVEERHGAVDKLKDFVASLTLEPETWGVDQDEMAPYVDFNREVVDLYTWWTTGRAEEHRKERALLDELYPDTRELFKTKEVVINGETVYELVNDDDEERKAKLKALWAYQDELRKKDQTMLHRLVEIREGLWT